MTLSGSYPLICCWIKCQPGGTGAEDKQVSAGTTDMRPCGWDLARRDPGSRAGRAASTSAHRAPFLVWPREPPVLTRFLGLDRGPRLLPNDGEGTRIRTTSRTVRAGRGSTKACGCGHAPKKGTQGPGASALPAAPPRGPAGTRREPPSTVAQTQLTATGSAGAGSALSGSPRGLRCGGEQNPRKPQLGAKGTGLVETGADQVQTARARGHVVLSRQLSQGNRSAHLYSLSTTPSQSSLVLQTQDVNSV